MNIIQLSDEQTQALILIRDNGKEPIRGEVINQLLSAGYIDLKFGGGWLLSCKGREYLRRKYRA